MIQVGDACQDMQAMFLKDDLMKCSILPPRHLTNLSFRFVAVKVCYSLYVGPVPLSRIEPSSARTKPLRKALAGTCVLDEIRLAVQKGYELVELHELYEYQVT